jgi:hypothetical protein
MPARRLHTGAIQIGTAAAAPSRCPTPFMLDHNKENTHRAIPYHACQLTNSILMFTGAAAAGAATAAAAAAAAHSPLAGGSSSS